MAAQSHNREVRCLCVLVCGCMIATGTTGASAYEIHVYQGQSIQAAINWVTDGDWVIVHPGTYYEAIDLLGKAITVCSINPEDPAVVQSTIINGDGAYHVVQCKSGETPATVVAGFTITGGNANGGPPEDCYGGGVFCTDNSSPTLTNCVIRANQAGFGGGVSCRVSSNPTLANCTISNNLVFWAHGGGVYCQHDSSPTLTNCTISENAAGLCGGGVCCQGNCTPTLTNCTISGNSAGVGEGSGGGVWCDDNCTPTLTNCVISGNSADYGGGGVCCDYHCSPTLTNCTISGNSAGEGGGVGSGFECSPTLANCTISGNSAQSGGGISGDFVATNCILWGDTPEEIPTDGSNPVVTYCDVEGGFAGEGNIDADPLFVDPENADYHLSAGSPCIDAANNEAVPPDTFDLDGDNDTTEPIPFDLDGNPRFVDDPETEDTGNGTLPIVDMGAYEYQVESCPADFDGDGDVDAADLLHLLGCWGTDCGDVDGDDDTDTADLLALLAAWGPCSPAGMMLVPGGEFEMGCHTGGCYEDELPVHDVYVDSFYMSVYETTNEEYCAYLNSAWQQGLIEVNDGVVYRAGDSEPYCDTYSANGYSRIHWDGSTFTVTSGKEDHPMLRVSWYGAVAYANWRSSQEGFQLSYDLETWECNWDASGYRLPTEAEWEYAARGGEHDPYYTFPWGSDIDGSNANYWESGDPYETGPYPWTTPVGYYDGGQIPPGVDMANGYGLYDAAGNVFEWCNDWYSSTYYSSSPYDNPEGPESGTYRLLRGGSWDGTPFYMRCALRNRADPDWRGWFVGLRLALPSPY